MNSLPKPVAADSIERAREVIRIEAEALARIEQRIDERFSAALNLLSSVQGKVIITGVGKSGLVARKIAATFNSTGSPSLFIHPIDALHGDLGAIGSQDVLLVLSKSGSSPELRALIDAVRQVDIPLIALVGSLNSDLAHAATVVLDCSVEREACSFDLAPTASTTAMMAMGDALAVALYEARGFTEEDFARTHPGGSLGRKLLLKLRDLMHAEDDVPTVSQDAPLSEAVVEMSRKRLGCTLVVDDEMMLQGIITDGDLRRLIERDADLKHLRAGEAMTPDPMAANPDELGARAIVQLEESKRSQLPVVDDRGRVVGIVHLHDLIEAGLRS